MTKPTATVLLLLTTLAVAPTTTTAKLFRRDLQVIQATPTLAICEGDELQRITQGCMTADNCAATAQSMGLALGNEEWPFAGDWADKGCIYYPADHPLYPNQAYFGEGGTCFQLKITPMAGGTRMSCDGSTRPPFNPTRCQGPDLCVTAEDCMTAAVANNLQLGSDEEPFEGPYDVKGCVYYPLDHPDYPGQSFWGSGASICGQLRADPRDYDGSVRLGCGGETDTEPVITTPVEENAGEDGPVNVVDTPVTPPPPATTMPRPPRPINNGTNNIVLVNGTANSNNMLDDGQPFDGPGPSISSFEGQESTSGAATSIGNALWQFGFVAFATFWAMK